MTGRLSAVFLAAVVLPALFSCTFIPRSLYVRKAAGTAQTGGHIRVANLNMLHGWPRFELLDERVEHIASELARLNPDVVILQEVPFRTGVAPQAVVRIANRLGSSLVYQRANGYGRLIGFEEGEAVLSRFPVISWEVHRLRPQPSPFERRIVLRLELETDLGRLEVYNTHLSDKPRRAWLRRGQAEDLVRYIRESHREGELPAILGGDFNADPGSDVYQLLLRSGFQDAGLPAGAATCCIDDLRNPTDAPEQRIDCLFLRGLEVLEAGLLFDRPFLVQDGVLWACDHLGLFIDGRVQPPGC
jgi:endonuclease/exonuclease/phosphatase family metal-dependent hydrolase